MMRWMRDRKFGRDSGYYTLDKMRCQSKDRYKKSIRLSWGMRSGVAEYNLDRSHAR